MLTRSKRGAFGMSAMAVLSFAIVSAILNILAPYLASGDIHAIIEHPEQLSSPGQLLSLGIFLVILLLILVGLGAFWIFRFFGERYFGARGALHWLFFGALLALLIKLPDWFLPDRLWWLRYPWLVASPFLAFFTARWLARIPLPPRRNAGLWG